jgi:predicted MPP superfamily phosphohydrolase
VPASQTAKIIYCVVYFFFYSSFIFAMLGRNHLPLGIQKALYLPGALWLGAMLYLSFWFLLTDGIYQCYRLICKIYDSSLRWRKIQVVAGYLLTFSLLSYGYYRFNHPVVAEKTIEIQKSAGNYRKLKIAAFSDLHLGVAIDKKRLQKYVQLINHQSPDLILIAGDVVDNNVLPLHLENMQEEINQLQAPLGVYMCLGNHEYLSGIEPGLEFLQKTQIRLLIDQVLSIEDSFWLIGRDDPHGNKRQALETLVAQTNPEQVLILIDHQPWHPGEGLENGIDLQFFGHTHRGQLWPLNYIADRLFPISYGYRQTGNTHTYVSSGLGLWGPPCRIGTQSEIVIFNLLFEE